MSIKLKNKRKRLNILLFVCLVILPWIVITAYTLMIAHPRYISSSDVVIKQSSDQSVALTGVSALLGVNNTSREDALYLTKYILSNDMIDKLDKEFKFREAYRVNGSDFINEIKPDATQEELREYFKKRVSVNLDEISHVLTVTTEGFEPEYAFKLNQAILRESERFVNDISHNMAKEQLTFVSGQVQEAEQRLNDAKQAVIDYQNKNAVFDPQVNAQMVNQVIGTLQGQLSSLRTEERQLLSYLNPEAPQVVSLRSQIRSVERQIKDEQAKLTSPKDAKLNAQTIEFEKLKSDTQFAGELYKIALTSLESSRVEVMRKMKNLVVITNPYQAQDALYPRVAYILGTSLVLLLILYGFVVLVLAVIRDHAK